MTTLLTRVTKRAIKSLINLSKMDYGQDSGLQWQEKHLIKAIFVQIINLKEDEIRTYVQKREKNHAKNGLRFPLLA